MSVEKVKNKRGTKWKARVTINNRDKCKTFIRKTDAKAWEKYQYELRDRNVINNSVDFDLTLGQLIADWKTFLYPKLERSSQDYYNKLCTSMKPLTSIKIVELNARLIDDWIIQLKTDFAADSKPKKAKRYSFKKEVEMLNQILKYYREYKNENYIVPTMKRHYEIAFLTKKPMKNSRQYLLADEVTKFLNELLKISLLHWRLARIQLETGCRIGEAAGVTWHAINSDRKEIYIEKIVCWDYRKHYYIKDGTKTGTTRKVFITKDLLKMLHIMKNEKNECDFIFNEDGKNLQYKHIQTAYNKAFRNAQLPFSGTHILRKTFATLFSECTNNMRATQAILGHKDSRMTSHYAKVTELAQKKSIELFDENRPFSCEEIEENSLLN